MEARGAMKFSGDLKSKDFPEDSNILLNNPAHQSYDDKLGLISTIGKTVYNILLLVKLIPNTLDRSTAL